MRKKIIEILIVAGILAGLAWFARLTFAEPLDTYHSGWHLVRETATEDGANFAAVYALATAEGNFANKDSSTVLTGGPFRIPTTASTNIGIGHSPGSKWMFAISGGLAENDTFSYSVVGWAKDNGMAQVIVEGTGIIGTQDVVLYPNDSTAATNIWWADTLTITSATLWPKQQGNLAGIALYNSGNNQVCLLVVETMGIEWIQFVLYDCDGSGTEANNLTVFGRRY